MIIELLIIVLLALLVTYSINRWSTSQSSYQGASALYDLSKPNQVLLPNANLPWSNRACAIRFAINVHQAPRTLAKVDCIVDSAKGFAPSCSDYTYKRCDCNGIQCGSSSSGSNCSLSEDAHSYLSKLLGCGDAIQLWASGYTSQTDKPYVPAILRLRTVKTVSQHSIESVTLPAIPLQGWTVITIVKEGRRIDVYYGSKLVASKILDYIPATSGGQPWTAGHKNWKGQIGLCVGIQREWTAKNVEADVASLVNSRGIPYILDEVNIINSFKALSIPACPFGTCDKMPVVAPQNPFMMHNSQFN